MKIREGLEVTAKEAPYQEALSLRVVATVTVGDVPGASGAETGPFEHCWLLLTQDGRFVVWHESALLDRYQEVTNEIRLQASRGKGC